MSFGSPFGGFGANNNNNNNQQPQQQQSAFGGFGANNNNPASGGFGASTTNTGFGSNNNTGSLFGGGNTTTTGFAGFGANNNNQAATTSAFGQSRPFGTPATSGGSLFGSNTGTANNTGFGTFGGSTNTNTTTGGFGNTANNTTSGFGASAGNSLFGNTNQANTGFGSSTGGGLFGQQNQNQNQTQNNAFGNTNNAATSGFGQNVNPSFGGSNNQMQNNGTGGTPFTPHSEKDANNSAQNQQFQSITSQPQYQNFQFEELRAVDYNQGRKYGNQSGQAGAFGATTGFGGFGASNNSNSSGFGQNTGSSLFGQNQSQNQPQGQNNAFGAASAGTGFGTNTGNSLFGAKPAQTSSLFGNTASSTGQQSGGMFGTSGNTGFGANNNANSGFGNTGGGLFGQQQNNTPKPGGIFGASNSTPNNAFGASNTGGGFGGSTGSLFGNNNTQTNNTPGFGQQPAGQTGGLFGQNQTQPNQQGGSLFGNSFGNQNQTQNQQKPGGLFGGSTTTGGGLFANNNQQQQPQQQATGGLFGNLNNQNSQTGGLFAPNQQKPNLFGAVQPTNNTTSSLFGAPNNQQQQAQGTTSLFGSLNNNQQKTGGSLFGPSNTNTLGGSNMFGGPGSGMNNQQNTGSSLFGQSNQSQQPQLGASLFGSTQPNQQTQQQQPLQQQPQQLSTSIQSGSPYGNEHLFASLATPTQSVGPLMTPLSSSQKTRKPAPLPTYRLNPTASSRLHTPQNRSGYGFDYSTYGTPGSALSNATPPMYGRSLLGTGSLNRSLGKSLSTTNLRGAYSSEESILSPGAFAAGGMGSGSGHMKKLKINRNLRTDLFGAEGINDVNRSSPLKKTVTFEGNDTTRSIEATNGSAGAISGKTGQELVRVEDADSPTPSAEEQGYLRSSMRSEALTSQVNGTSSSPEMEQVKGNELAVVPENETAGPATSATTTKSHMTTEEAARFSQKDMEPGPYYMIPSKAEIEKMSRKDRSKIKSFIVGRENTGKIEFGEVDLSGIDLDKIMGDIVQITQRTATVYPNHANKPPVGKGLNLPSRVTLDNSWPRSKGGKVPVFERKGPRFEKHIERLKRVTGTEFEKYLADTGQWIFRVAHFSTYTLEYEDDEDQSMLSPPPTNISARSSTFMSRLSAGSRAPQEETIMSNASSGHDTDVDDTFEFRTSRSLPGAFDQSFSSDMDADELDDRHEVEPENEYSNEMLDESHSPRPESIVSDAEPMTGMYDGAIDDDSPLKHRQTLISPIKPKSILKSTRRDNGAFTPSKIFSNMDGNWASQLQRTISPKKQNRQILRESQGAFFKGQRVQPEAGATDGGKAKNPFATSIDIMNSLFAQGPKSGMVSHGEEQRGFQWPYAKRDKRNSDKEMTDADRKFHESFKPSWAFDGTLIYSATGPTASPKAKAGISIEGNDNRFGLYATIAPAKVTEVGREQQRESDVVMQNGCPRMLLRKSFEFASFAHASGEDDGTVTPERLMWVLASILFDGITEVEDPDRKTMFSNFWGGLVKESMSTQLKKASEAGKDSAEIALIQLSGHEIADATASLIEGKNYRLSTMIAQIGGDKTMREGFAAQLEDWRNTNTISEMSPAIRATYELLAGNTCTAKGKSGVAAEDKAETFNISSRFGLDWERAFGLKLWYGKFWEEETLADVVEAYIRDLAAFTEEVKPVPWFVRDKVDTGWEDPRKDERQDILLGLLKIYAFKYKTNSADDFLSSRVKFADVISPENVAGNPTDARLSFQLYQTLSTKGIMDFDEDERAHKADLLTTDYAFQLSADAASLCDAIFVIMHLSDAAARELAIKALLSRHAGVIPDNADTGVFARLTTELQLPPAWIWTAKALYAKAVLADHAAECRFLLAASDDGDDASAHLAQAHDVLRRVLAPCCIIEEDYATLREALVWFAHRGADAHVPAWDRGGGLYADYLRLLEVSKHGDKNEATALAERLGGVLGEMDGDERSLDETVALTEIARGINWAIADVAWRSGSIDPASQVVALPGEAHDSAFQKTVQLSELYYSSVQA